MQNCGGKQSVLWGIRKQSMRRLREVAKKTRKGKMNQRLRSSTRFQKTWNQVMEYLPFLKYANLYPKKKLSKYVYDFMLYILQPVDVCPEAPIIRK